MVLKPSERVPLTTVKMMELLHEKEFGVEFPPGLVRVASALMWLESDSR